MSGTSGLCLPPPAWAGCVQGRETAPGTQRPSDHRGWLRCTRASIGAGMQPCRGTTCLGTTRHILGGIPGRQRQGGGPVSPHPLVAPQDWMTPTSMDVAWRWLTSTAMAGWTLSTATGMGRTASTCKAGPLGVSDSG